jgi:hypothetical protein
MLQLSRRGAPHPLCAKSALMRQGGENRIGEGAAMIGLRETFDASALFHATWGMVFRQ